jgi:EAL domain-containing protein (putative c-di-GMP-specific phosphodiesterase class I)
VPVAVEALVRWRQPDGRLTPPVTFIPLAEEMGLIKGLGDWVMETAFATLHPLVRGPLPLRRVAINVSPRQLQGAGFAQLTKRLLAECGLPPECLELEITEGVLLDGSPEVAINLKMLCDLGVRLAIDDFGTGYSSLGYLQRYPFDTLKIDRSFVSDAVVNPAVARLVETIITMAQGLGLEVVAEGVETDEQLTFLRDRGCDSVQGFLFSPAVPKDELVIILETWGKRTAGVPLLTSADSVPL